MTAFNLLPDCFTVLFFLLGLLGCFLFRFLLCHSRTSMKNHSYLRTDPTSPVSVRILSTPSGAFKIKNENREKFFHVASVPTRATYVKSGTFLGKICCATRRLALRSVLVNVDFLERVNDEFNHSKNHCVGTDRVSPPNRQRRVRDQLACG